MKFQDVEVCDCDCHRVGRNVMHFMACCNLCYLTYLTEDGEIIPEKLQPLLRKSHLEKTVEVVKKGLK